MDDVLSFLPADVRLTPRDFDVLDCPIEECGKPTPAHEVEPGPTVAYACECGARWKIAEDGEMIGLKRPRRRS